MKRTAGFTVIELFSVIILIFIIGSLVFVQKVNIEASERDRQRKTSINAIYYGLKQGYYPKKGSYPTKLSPSDMPYVDPQAFKNVGEDKSYSLQYKGIDCVGGNCAAFELHNKLEKESEYKKTSRD